MNHPVLVNADVDLHVDEEWVLRGLVPVERRGKEKSHLGEVVTLERHLHVERPRLGLFRQPLAQDHVIAHQKHFQTTLSIQRKMQLRKKLTWKVFFFFFALPKFL